MLASIKRESWWNEYGNFPVKIYVQGLKNSNTGRKAEKYFVRSTSERPDI